MTKPRLESTRAPSGLRRKSGQLPHHTRSVWYAASSVRFGQFGRLVRATAWVFLSWTAVDLGVPSVCALDQEDESLKIHSSSERVAPASTPHDGTPEAPVHVDDCFCCSHCVNVTAIHTPATLALVGTDVALPSDSVPVAAGYPPYHPPRA